MKPLDPVKQSILDDFVIERIRPFKRTVYLKAGGKRYPITEMGMKMVLKRRVKKMGWGHKEAIGVWVNPEASKKLRYAAVTKTEIFQFAYALEPKGISVHKKVGKASIKVDEIGRAIELKDGLSSLEHFDSNQPVQKMLIWILRNLLDRCSASALKLPKVRVTGVAMSKSILGVKWSSFEATLGVALGYLSSSCHPYDKHTYIGIGGKGLISQIRKLRSFIPWRGYLKPGDVLMRGEAGLTHNNIRWIKCLDKHCFLNDGVIFGENGLMFRETITPELRAFSENGPFSERGLSTFIAWYGVMGFGGQNVVYIPEMKR